MAGFRLWGLLLVLLSPVQSFFVHHIKNPTLGAKKKYSTNSDDDNWLPDEDWRQFRAKLIAQDKGQTVENGGEWAHETTLLEKGSILLGGSQSFGFEVCNYYHYFNTSSPLIPPITHTPGRL